MGAEPAHADLARASDLFQRGKRAFASEAYADAGRAFDEAHATVADASASFNAALAWEKADDAARAADAYVRALETPGLDSVRSRDATRALARLEARLARVVVRTTPVARVEVGYRNGSAPLLVHLPPGRYQVIAVFPDGARVTRPIEVGRSALTVDLDRAAPAPPALERPVEPRVADASVLPSPIPTAPGGLRVVPILGLGAIALAGAGAGTGIALGAMGLEARDDFDASGRTDAGARDQAIGLRTGANVAWGVAGALAVTGAVLLAVSWGDDGAPPTTAGLCAGPAAIHICSAF